MVNQYDANFYKVIEDAVDFAWNPELPVETDELKVHQQTDDKVNSPSHYTKGKVEAIDVIEDAIRHAPDPVVGMLQAQVLKYVLRCWHKGNAEQDLQKSEWYLRRLIKAVSNV